MSDKIVNITHKDPFFQKSGKLYYAVCEYDDFLLSAHRVAKKMADEIGCKISDLRYEIIEKISNFGCVYSVSASDITKKSVVGFDSDFMHDSCRNALLSMKEGKGKFHNFEEINVKQYEKMVYTGETGGVEAPF